MIEKLDGKNIAIFRGLMYLPNHQTIDINDVNIEARDRGIQLIICYEPTRMYEDIKWKNTSSYVLHVHYDEYLGHNADKYKRLNDRYHYKKSLIEREYPQNGYKVYYSNIVFVNKEIEKKVREHNEFMRI